MKKLNQHFGNILSPTIPSLLAALCSSCLLIILQWPNLQKLTAASDVVSQDALKRQLDQEQLRLALWKQMPSLGFDNLLADWTFLSFLQYFGDDEVRLQTGYTLSPNYFEALLDKDPYFWDAYLFLSGSTTLYAGQPKRTIEIMEQHLPQLSPKVPDRAYFIWRWKSVDELLFLDDVEAAINSHMMASQWAAEYDTEEGQMVARVSQQSAQFLRENPADKSVQINAWMSIYVNAFDTKTQQFAIDNIRSLGGDVVLDEDGNVIDVQIPEN